LHGLLRPGDHVVTSLAEHNSVLRPLRFLEETRSVEVSRVGISTEGYVDIDALAAAVRPTTKLVALIHASNVTGSLQPIDRVAQIAHQSGALFLVDAAQSLGTTTVDVAAMGIDLLAAPSHKGLLGTLGLGVLYVGAKAERHLESVRQGGTGTQSEDDHQPTSLPYKFESGNANVPGIVGLEAGLEYLRERTIIGIRRKELELTGCLREGLARIRGVNLHGPGESDPRVGVVSLTIDGFDPHEVASTLDAVYSIQVRSGLHCAPSMHRALGTLDRGGTVRLSLGPFTTREHVDRTVSAIAEIAGSAVS
jgi:selenocysteine lyase/cysteine desulfurase